MSTGEVVVAWGVVTPPLRAADLAWHAAWSLVPGVGHVISLMLSMHQHRGVLLVVTDRRVCVLWDGASAGDVRQPCVIATECPLDVLGVRCVAEGCFELKLARGQAQGVLLQQPESRLARALEVLARDDTAPQPDLVLSKQSTQPPRNRDSIRRAA
ncbi:MAG: hypothetical protein MUE97_01335 [Phycisphaerales bacterium]|nr:hypothetical protein [Phycisphaerales bacterium]